jgi:predicted ATP-dependent endonuclease of OLD family
MKLTLKNIGILKDAEIDLSKDLIILCGPNNTGKTYAAYTVYAVNRYAYENEGSDLIDFETEINSETKESLINEGTVSINIWDLFLSNENKFSEIFINSVNNKLNSVFDTSKDFFKNSLLGIKFDYIDLKKRFNLISLEKTINAGNIIIRFIKKPDELSLVISVLVQETETAKSSNLKVIATNIIPRLLSDFMIQGIFPRTYFSPVERIAINLFSKQLSIQRNKLVDDLLYRESSGTSGIGGTSGTSGILSRARLYPLPIRDCLEIAERLTEYQKQKSDFEYLANFFESEILHGKVTVSAYGEVQYKPDNANIAPLGIHLSASMVKSLSSLVFYFRHIARKGDFIIIDEPELNLHPDNQRKVSKLLARIVNAGFKVMISTHSDYIYRELNNQIMLNKDSEIAKKLRNTYNYAQAELLDHNKVGAYLFLGNETNMLPVTETGFEVKTIDDEIGKLNEASMEIFTSLF